jgi:aspartyl aminopeptidase
MTDSEPPDADDVADGLAGYLDASPTPFHATAAAAALLDDAGFVRLDETASWPTAAGRYYLVRDGSLVAWHSPEGVPATAPFRVIGAHTDSPTLRIKPQPDVSRAGLQLLGVEVYGGPLLATWTDRDLGLAGRVALRGPAGVEFELIRVDEPLLRVSQLAIHFNRTVNTEGLVLNPQQHLAPHWALGDTPGDLTGYLAEQLHRPASDVLAWDLMAYDLTPARRIGRDLALLAGGRLDNQATCFAGLSALLAAAARSGAHRQVLVLFDHEEVGSVSARGAASTLLAATLERIVVAAGGDRTDLLRSLAGSVVASGDMAHATHPNYAEFHEPQHRIAIGGGPVLKINNNLRYATDAAGAAAFVLACERAGVPLQRFVMRSDLPCGSTVGPLTAAGTGITTVDIGAPMLSMHSAREVCGVADQAMYVAALTAFLD